MGGGKKVIVRIRDDNIPSQRIAIKNGFTRTNDYELVDYPACNQMNVKLRTYVYGEQVLIH